MKSMRALRAAALGTHLHTLLPRTALGALEGPAAELEDVACVDGLCTAVHDTATVWTLPELAAGGGGGGRAKVTLDTTARIPDTWPTGVQFTRHHGARPGAAPNIAVSVYDSHLLRVFLGL